MIFNFLNMLKVFYSALEPIFKGLEKEGFEKKPVFQKNVLNEKID